METAIMKVKDIKPAKYNPRKNLKQGDAEYEALQGSMERFDCVVPLIINKTTGTLVSGHQRLNVLKAKGIEEVEAVLVEADEEQEKLLNIALNKIDGDWDYKKLEALFEDISAEDIKFTGFTEEELSNLFDTDLPDWDEKEKEDDGGSENEEKAETPEKPKELKEFNIFLSFPTKELAEEWMKKKGVELAFEGTARNITIRMEGLDYGTGN